MAVLPSGEQIEIQAGKVRATIVEVSGGLRTLQVGDLEVLDGYPAEEMCHDARGQLLMPWPNRLAGGKYEFEGQQYQVPINEPSHDNAIHGLVRWSNWPAADRTADRVTMTHRLYPQPGYPFILDLSATYRVVEDGLEVTLRATNAGTSACPFGAGQHPYIRAGTPTIDRDILHIPARCMYRYNDQLIPVERVPVTGTSHDFLQPHPIGDTALNMDYTDLERDADGRARVTLQAPDGGPTVTFWLDEAFHHITVYTGETVQPPSRRRHGLAVEPMTCPPNAFQSGEDLIVLQPGESWEGHWGIMVQKG